jgi:hypothetical protein
MSTPTMLLAMTASFRAAAEELCGGWCMPGRDAGRTWLVRDRVVIT